MKSLPPFPIVTQNEKIKAADFRFIAASRVNCKELPHREFFRAGACFGVKVSFITTSASPPARRYPAGFGALLEDCVPDKTLTVFPPAMRALVGYSRAGHLRELQNTTQRITLGTDGAAGLRDLPPGIQDSEPIELPVKKGNQCVVTDSSARQGTPRHEVSPVHKQRREK